MEDFKGGFFVLELAAFVLALGGEAGGSVGDANGGIGGVYMLAAGAASTEGFDPEVVFGDVPHFNGWNFGNDFDAGK